MIVIMSEHKFTSRERGGGEVNQRQAYRSWGMKCSPFKASARLGGKKKNTAEGKGKGKARPSTRIKAFHTPSRFRYPSRRTRT